MSTIKSSTTTTTAYSVTADTTGTLVLQTGATPITAVTIGTDQSVTFAQAANLPNTFGFKNRLINGGMVIDQRNAGASVTVDSSNPIPYTLDRWNARQELSSGAFTVQRSTTAPTGFTNSLLATVTTADASITSSEGYSLYQVVEGFNSADLGWGTAAAQSVTISFWARSSVTGSFSLMLINSAFARNYGALYTINSANTWEYKTVVIPGDTSGTWLTDNGVGIRVGFGLGAGTNRTASVGWSTPAVSNTKAKVTGGVDWIATSGATFYITGVQLEKGSTATSFDYRPYGTELALCQRYFYKHQNTNGGNSYPIMLQAYSTTAAFGKICDLPVTMRTNPTSSTTATSGTFTPSAANGTAAGAFTATVIETSTVNALCTGAWTGSSGLVAGNVTTVTMPNNAFFSASAEL
jgi:hypothetical protein